MAATQSVTQADEVIEALEALRARWSAQQSDQQDSSVLQQASELIAQLKELVSSLDGQLSAMRWLAQKQFRSKGEHVPEGQLALELLGFMLQPKAADAPSGEQTAAPDVAPDDKPEPRAKRKSRMHLLPVVQTDVRLDEQDRICSSCQSIKAEIGFEPKRYLVFEPAKLYFREELLYKYACKKCQEGVVAEFGICNDGAVLADVCRVRWPRACDKYTKMSGITAQLTYSIPWDTLLNKFEVANPDVQVRSALANRAVWARTRPKFTSRASTPNPLARAHTWSPEPIKNLFCLWCATAPNTCTLINLPAQCS